MNTDAFVKSPDDLVTTHEAYRAGVLEIALFKDAESIPYLDKAKALYVQLRKNTKKCTDILQMPELHEVVLEAAGITQKTKKHLSAEDKKELLGKFIAEVLQKAGDKYVDEVVYRYLMALGEQLGGRMRNRIGDLARIKVIRSIIAQLSVSGTEFKFAVDKKKEWIPGNEYKPAMAGSIKALSWQVGAYGRTYLNNVNVAGLSKNVDMVLIDRVLDDVSSTTVKAALLDSKCVVMMGELKGGIDPAGGDEHWKTARGALERIRASYKRADLVFICASIEKAMAKEIFSMLEMGSLNCVANLTNENQLSSACDWIVKL